MSFKDATNQCIAVGTLVAIAFGGYFYIEKRFALAEELDKVKNRLEYKIKSDQLLSIQDRIWRIEDRMEDAKPTPTEKEELRKLKEDKEAISGTIKALEGK